MPLNQSGMTHISLVLMFTYVNDNSKRRTDGAGSLLLSHNVHFSFSGQNYCSVLLCTAARDTLVQRATRRCKDSMNQTNYPQGESQCCLFMGKWKIHIFANSKLEAFFIARTATRGRHHHTLSQGHLICGNMAIISLK